MKFVTVDSVIINLQNVNWVQFDDDELKVYFNNNKSYLTMCDKEKKEFLKILNGLN